MYRMKVLAERKVKSHEAMNYFLRVLCDADAVGGNSTLTNERALKKVQSLFDGQGRGAELDSAKGTAWGLLNAVTEYVDHERRARSDDHRTDSALFGSGALIKQRALDTALALAPCRRSMERNRQIGHYVLCIPRTTQSRLISPTTHACQHCSQIGSQSDKPFRNTRRLRPS